MNLPQDRFEILKYSILIEENLKQKIIEKIIMYSSEKSFISMDAYGNWMNLVKNKLKKFSKKAQKRVRMFFIVVQDN